MNSNERLHASPPMILRRQNELMSVVIEPAALLLTPGQVSHFSIQLTNLSKEADWFYFTFTGAGTEWLHAMRGPVAVPPEKQVVLPLTVQVPRLATSYAQQYVITLTIRAQEQPALPLTFSLPWQVAAFRDAVLQLTPYSESDYSQADYILGLRNEGNVPGSYQFSVTDDWYHCGYEFTPALVSLGPGEQAQVALHIMSRPHWLGKERTIPFHVQASTPDNLVMLSEQGTFIQQAVIPTWWLYTFLTAIMVMGLAVFSFAWVNLPSTPDRQFANEAASGAATPGPTAGSGATPPVTPTQPFLKSHQTGVSTLLQNPYPALRTFITPLPTPTPTPRPHKKVIHNSHRGAPVPTPARRAAPTHRTHRTIPRPKHIRPQATSTPVPTPRATVPPLPTHLLKSTPTPGPTPGAPGVSPVRPKA